MTKLRSIGAALGPEKVRSDLLPYLEKWCTQDEDELLSAMATALGTMAAEIGGPEQIISMLPLLEQLCITEETVVRDCAVASLCILGKLMPLGDIESGFVPMLTRLYGGDTADSVWFTSRMSACSLFGTAYRCESARLELRKRFLVLCKDTTPMVRRSAARAVAGFSLAMKDAGDHEKCAEEVLPIFEHLSKDDQDSVKTLCVEQLPGIAKSLPEELQAGRFVNMCRACAEEPSWRVRRSFTLQLVELAGPDAMGASATKDVLVPLLFGLLRDTEADVRKDAIKVAKTICAEVPAEVLESELLECVKAMVGDPELRVKVALCDELPAIAALLGPESATTLLLPILNMLLQDEVSDVRLRVVGKLTDIAEVVGADALVSAIPMVVIATDESWRVRMSLCEFVPLIAAYMDQATFDKTWKKQCEDWFNDPVCQVRLAAGKTMAEVHKTFGEPWTREFALPTILETYKASTNYLHRMTALSAAAQFFEAGAHALIEEQVVTVMLLPALTADRVANVKFKAARVVSSMVGAASPGSIEQLTAALQLLVDHSDHDVAFYSAEALALCA